jgi:hypothetical protein
LAIVRSPANDLFYRAAIIDVDENVNVYFFDHGVCQKVDISRILPFAKEFLYLPPFGIKCKLQSIKLAQAKSWSKEAIELFKKLGGNPKMVYEGKFSNQNRFIECPLIDPIELFFFNENQINISTELVKLRYASLDTTQLVKQAKVNIDPFDALESVSCVRKRAPGKHTKSVSLHYNELPEEDEEFRKKRINEYVDFQSEHTQILEADFERNFDENELDHQLKVPPINKNSAKRVLKCTKAKNEEVDTLDVWNPAKEHFDSMRNAYGYNEKSFEAHKFGYG